MINQKRIILFTFFLHLQYFLFNYVHINSILLGHWVKKCQSPTFNVLEPRKSWHFKENLIINDFLFSVVFSDWILLEINPSQPPQEPMNLLFFLLLFLQANIPLIRSNLPPPFPSSALRLCTGVCLLASQHVALVNLENSRTGIVLERRNANSCPLFISTSVAFFCSILFILQNILPALFNQPFLSCI